MPFPSLSTPPLVSGYEHSAALDPVLRSPLEAGYRQTRPRFTRVPKKWHISYSGLSDSDQSALESFEASVKYGADSFTWTHPKTSTQYTVRFPAPVRYHLGPTDTLWSAEFDLEEV
jgi:phage-related protein